MFKINYISVLLISVACASCGGGGGGGATKNGPEVSSPSLNSAPQLPVDSYIPLQTEVPMPGYAVGSAERLGFDLLNAERSKCGFGKLIHNKNLDRATENHTNYFQLNGGLIAGIHPHHEDPLRPYFTGVTPADRAAFAGYGNMAVAEVGVVSASAMANLDFANRYDTQKFVENAVRGWLNTPYHGWGVLSPSTDVGMYYSLREKMDGMVQNVNWDIFMNLGWGSTVNGQHPPFGGNVRTYPCDGSDNVPPYFAGEWTGGAPVVPDDLAAQGFKPSAPILIFGDLGSKLSINSAEILRLSTNEKLKIWVIRTKENDPNPQFFVNDNWGYVMAQDKFITGESYMATIKGKNGSNAFIRTISFKVGQPEE